MRYRDAMRAFERAYWERMMREHKNVRATALAAGVRRTALYKILTRLEIQLPYTDKRSSGHRGNWGGLK